ncbi:hypothetical protein D3C87_1776330 [compost metagenome]
MATTTPAMTIQRTTRMTAGTKDLSRPSSRGRRCLTSSGRLSPAVTKRVMKPITSEPMRIAKADWIVAPIMNGSAVSGLANHTTSNARR